MVYEPKSTVVVFPYERQAKEGDEMPEGIEYPDQIAFLCFRMLYAQLRQGVIDRETAIREKKKILQEYEQYKFAESIGKEWVKIIRETENARSSYRKARTLENADKLICSIEGIGISSKKAEAKL